MLKENTMQYFLVSASNAKGDSVSLKFELSQAAHVMHKKLWQELDDNGDLKWGTVRTTVLEEAA